MLNSVEKGTGGTPLLLVHGLFGSARNLGQLVRPLARDRRTISVDMRNHGDSFHDAAHSYADMAQDLAQVLEAQVTGPADVLGHSMGGKAAMMLALTRPDLVRKLVVLDIAPVAYGHSQTPLIDAMRGLDLDGISKRSEADARLAEVIQDRGTRAFLLQSLDLTTKTWRLNLDALAHWMDAITGWPDAVSGQYAGPALFLFGGASDYVTPDMRDTIKGLFPKAELAEVAGVGHWLHAEKPAEVSAAVQAFLDA